MASPELAELSRCLATEVASLTNRLVSARAQDLIRGLEAARKAIEDASTPLDEDLNVQALGDDELQRIRERLSSNPALEAVRRQLLQRTEASNRLTEALDEARTGLAAVRAELDAEKERAQSVPAEMVRMAAEFESTIEDLRREHLTAVEEQQLTSTSLPLDALLSVFNTLGRATTSTEVFDAVVAGLAREFSRVALFAVQPTHLEGTRQTGFNFESDISKLRLPANGDSLPSKALSSGTLETHFPNLQTDADVALPFGGTPSCAMAIPFSLKGAVTAVLYADDSDRPEFATAAPQTRAKFAELLHQHASLVLLSVEVAEKAAAEIREFDALLLEEIEYAHNGDVKAGKNALERQQTLRHNVEHARRMHGERTRQDPAAAAAFDEYLGGLVDARQTSIFARELASVIGVTQRGPRASVLTMRR